MPTRPAMAGPAMDQESASLMPDVEPAPTPAGGTRIESLTIRPTENGGFVVSVSKRPANGGAAGESPAYEPSKDFAFTSADDALEHVGAELGLTSGPEALEAPMPAGQMPAARMGRVS